MGAHGKVEQIGRYEILSVLGEGAMGRVYLARDPRLGRTVALKMLGKGSGQPEMEARFRREAHAVAQLKHPNIVELYDVSESGKEQLYFVMEYVAGASLFVRHAKHGNLPEATALAIGHELCLALEHAHAQGIVHRDIKPENILLHEGRLVLTDFGIVKQLPQVGLWGRRPAAKTRSLGTPGFMAPEQFKGQDIDVRTDIFALGAVLYNLTTGHVPYEGTSVERIHRNLKRGRLVDPRAHKVALSVPFCNLLAGCLAPTPRDRFASARALRQALMPLLRQAKVAEPRDELRAWEEAPTVWRRSRPEAAALDAQLSALRAALLSGDAQAVGQLALALDLPTPPPAKMTWGRRDRRLVGVLLGGVVIGVLLTVAGVWLGVH